MNGHKKSYLGVVFLTVFLDIVGFSILFPLFPKLLDHYLALEGTASGLGRLVARLESIVDGDRAAVVALFGGILGSLYGFLQFVFAPIWGGLSDRIGRRSTLLFTLFGTLAGYVLWIFSGSFLLLVVSRVLNGIMAGNISIASAVVADTTAGEKRAGGMGIVGMAIGLGFVLGPALGGLTSTIVPENDGSWVRGWALHPFSLPAAIAAALALVNLVWVATRLPETLPAEHRAGIAGHARTWNPLAALAKLDLQGVWRTTLVSFLYLSAFSAMEFTLTFLAHDRFEYEPRQIAWMFVFVGFVIAFVQGGVVRRLAPRLGEKKLTLFGLAALVPGFFAIAWASTPGALYGGLFLMAVGSALAMPCLSALCSRYAPVDRQGLVLGQFRSAGSLARALGPIVGGALYWKFGSFMPYLAGGLFLLIPLYLATKLPPVTAARDGSGE